jgi:hypothetical protein
VVRKVSDATVVDPFWSGGLASAMQSEGPLDSDGYDADYDSLENPMAAKRRKTRKTKPG